MNTTNMAELSLAARGYYRNSTREDQETFERFFHSMDVNRDGRISFDEFCHFLSQSGYTWVNPNTFVQLDANRDGELDFWEFMTFYYMVKTRAVFCHACLVQLPGLHFTCVTCFDHGRNTYDLCASCYEAGRFLHAHNHFLDTYVLLRSKRGICAGVNVTQAITRPQNNNQPGRNEWFNALELAVGVGNLVSLGTIVGCHIM